MTSKRVALLGLILFTGISLIWLVNAHCSPFFDASLYVIATKSLLAGDGYALNGSPFTLRPPGFVLLLAPLFAAFGTDFFVLNLFISVIGIVAVVLAFLYFERPLGVPIAIALAVGLWLNPCTRRYCNLVMADLAGVALLLAALLIERRVFARPTWRGIVLLGVVVAAAAYLRSVYLLLAPAFALSWLLRRGGAPAGRSLVARLLAIGAFVGVVAVLQAPWQVWKRYNPPLLPLETVGNYSYATNVLHEHPWDPTSPRLTMARLSERVAVRAAQITGAVGDRLRTLLNARSSWTPGDPFALALGGVMLACLVAVALRSRDPGSLFALLNIAALLVFADFSYRLVLPIYVLALVATVRIILLVATAPTEFGPGPRPGLVRIGLAVALLALGVLDFGREPDRPMKIRQHETCERLRDFVQSRYPEPVPIAALNGHVVAGYFDREVRFLELMWARHGGYGAREVMRKYDIGVLIVTHAEAVPHLRPELFARWRRVWKDGEMTVWERPDLAGSPRGG